MRQGPGEGMLWLTTAVIMRSTTEHALLLYWFAAAHGSQDLVL